MDLTMEEQAMLDGEQGPAVKRAMEILISLGKALDAERLAPISMVHIPGSSIVSSKDIGLEFAQGMYAMGAQCRVPTSLNTSAIDEERWKELRIPEVYYQKQKRYTETFRAMGAITNHTCTPYLVGMLPTFREHITWGETTAATFVNSVLGARTNLAGGPEALAASITGRAPLCGFHLDENRRGNILIEVKANLDRLEDFKAASYYYGKNFGQFADKKWVPVWSGLPHRPSLDEYKALSYASGLFHVPGHTPEARIIEEAFGWKKPMETIVIDDAVIRNTYAELCTGSDGGVVDFVVTGCPHASITEMGKTASLLSEKKIHRGVDFWVCTSYQVKRLADYMGYTRIIEDAGATVVSGTCPALAPMHDIAVACGYQTCASNTSIAHLIRARGGIKTAYFGTLEDLVDSAITGKWEGKRWRK